jgi:hypothetical protein
MYRTTDGETWELADNDGHPDLGFFDGRYVVDVPDDLASGQPVRLSADGQSWRELASHVVRSLREPIDEIAFVAVGRHGIVAFESPFSEGRQFAYFGEAVGAPGAMPTTIGGEPVLRGETIAAYVAAATDDTPFLIGGLIDFFFVVDCFVPPDFPETLLLRPCGGWPSIGGIALVTDDWHPTPSQRYVLRVHVHDPRAADCPPAYREQCERAVVVDEVVWQPDR